MKYSAAYIAALASLSNASPVPQFSIPAFSIPSFSIPSFSIPSGGGFSIPSIPVPTGGAGAGIPSLGNIAAATSTAAAGSNLPSGTQPTATSAAQATPTNSGTVGSDCTAQGSSGGLGSTENGVTDKNCCTGLTVIFARGTSELGNVGSIAGPPMFESLRTKLGADKVTVQGLDYAASIAGNAALGADGAPDMASLVETALSQCPSTKVVLSGYSQGAMVVHNVLSAQGISSSQVTAAVLFGDPLISQPVGDLSDDKVKEFCGSADIVCLQPTGDVTGDHLSYGSAADAAADFVISAVGLS